MSNTGWDRSLGTSKKAQGIITPPPPRKKKNCNCWYRGRELMEMCQTHQDGLNNILKNMQIMAQQRKAMEEQKKQEDSPAAALEEEIKKEAPYSGFVENTDVTESTKVELT